MFYWIWRLLWWSPQNVQGTSRWRQLRRLSELEARVDALESRLQKLQGRVTGGVRVGDDQLELEPGELALDLVDESIDESRSLGAATRWGKS